MLRFWATDVAVFISRQQTLDMSLLAVRKEALAAHDLTRQTMKSQTWRNFQPFKKGAMVWLEGRNLKHSLPNPKFAAKQEGPFTITEVLSPVTYKL